MTTPNNPNPTAKPEPVYEDIKQPEEPPIAGEYVEETTPPPTGKRSPIIDARTGEIVPVGAMDLIAMPETDFNFNAVGTLELTPSQMEAFDKPFEETDFLIRPEGMLYIQWTLLADRLNQAFGRFKWGLVPQGKPMIKDEGDKALIMQMYWLIVKGIVISSAVGENTYYKSNFAGSYGDAIEGAKSNALMRCCKSLNIGNMLRMWDHEFGEEWKKKYAEYGPFGKNNKMIWRKRIGPAKTMKDFISALVPNPIPTQSQLSAFCKAHNITWLEAKHDQLINHTKQLWLAENPVQKSAAQAEEDING